MISNSSYQEVLTASGLNVDAEYALMPVNYTENHWALLLWKVAEGQFFYFDSFGLTAEKALFPDVQGSHKACKFLIEHFSKEKEVKRRVKVYNVNVPIQTNKEDCGPLVLVMMERLIENKGEAIKNLNPENYKKSLCKWFNPADEALSVRKKLSILFK